MASKDLTFKIQANPDDAVRGFDKVAKAAKRSMKETEDALDDTRTAGQKLADAISKDADEMMTSMRQTATAADALANALGSEFAAEVGQGGIDKFVIDLQRAGLTAEEVEADVDALAASIKKMEDVQGFAASRGGFDDVGGAARRARGSVDEVKDSARGAGSAMANMVGNTAQDLGSVAGIAGSAGVAIGQMAEYAADARVGGEKLGSALGSMAKVAGPIGALGLATAALGAHLEGIKAEKAFRADLVADFGDAIREADTLAESLLSTLRETGDIEFSAQGGGFLGLGREMQSLLPIIDELGISTEQLMADLSDPAARDRIREQAKDIERYTDDQADAMVDYADAIDQYGDSWREAQAAEELSSRFAREMAKSQHEAGEATREHQRRVDELADAYVESSGMIRESEAATEDATDATDAATEALEDHARAQGVLEQALYETTAQWDELTGALDDNEAFRNVERAFEDVHAAAVESFEAASTGAEDASEKARDHASAVDAMKQEVIDYAREVANISPRQTTDILALIDEGKFEEAEARLRELERARSTTLTVRVQATGDTGVFSANRGSRIINEARALGGPVEAGTPYTVNELGPRGSEMFVSAKDGRVVSRAAASQAISEGVAMANSGGGGLSARDLAALADAVKAGAREGAYLGALAGNKDLSSSIRGGSRF